MLPDPAPSHVVYRLSAADKLLAALAPADAGEHSKVQKRAPNDEQDAVLTSIRSLLQLARETGDQRLLGQALSRLDADFPNPTANADISLLRADLYQALHRFQPAIAELQRVLQRQPENPQALLMLASLQLVRGDYESAQIACKQLLGLVPPLLSGSCGSIVLARQGGPQKAYELLERLYEQTSPSISDSNVLHYAQVSLAEIADQLGNTSARDWWYLALQSQPRDLYTRIGAARNALYRGDPNEVIRLSEGFDDVDALQLLRAQALQNVDPAAAGAVREKLALRVQLARERGDTLHARDQAAILLDLLQQPADALALAQQNWSLQREPEDTLLLLRAAIAAGRADVEVETRRWLAQRHQSHARYPQPSSDAREGTL
ncbi:MAG TPA: tetratricopeptide repeat protein [Dongiaceae bacterium]|nr:tetratricopeptide repeat protein [Dongiaceae bacterium]